MCISQFERRAECGETFRVLSAGEQAPAQLPHAIRFETLRQAALARFLEIASCDEIQHARVVGTAMRLRVVSHDAAHQVQRLSLLDRCELGHGRNFGQRVTCVVQLLRIHRLERFGQDLFGRWRLMCFGIMDCIRVAGDADNRQAAEEHDRQEQVVPQAGDRAQRKPHKPRDQGWPRRGRLRMGVRGRRSRHGEMTSVSKGPPVPEGDSRPVCTRSVPHLSMCIGTRLIR